MMIKDLTDGTQVYGRYLVADAKKCVSNANKPYLSITFQDASGIMEARKWDVLPGDEELLQKGTVVYVVGTVLSYGNRLQMKVMSVEKVDDSAIDWSAYIPSAPVSEKELEAKLDAYVSSIQDEAIHAIVARLLEKYKEKYLNWPAASRNHHAFVSGLLYHSVTMADLAAKVSRVYSSLNRDLMIGGTLIHDIGKVMELSGPNATFYTVQGRLIGHISIGQAEVREVAKELGYYAFVELPQSEQDRLAKENAPEFHCYEIALQMEHIILSHHGKYEFGSPVLPLTREALAISLIDDFDAKMLVLDNAYSGVNPGEPTGRIGSLDNRYFYLPRDAKTEHSPYGTSLEEQLQDLGK